MKITKIKEDITSEIANSFKESIAIDTEATGLQIPERDKLSLIQICDVKGNVFIIQPNKSDYKAPNLVSVLENDKILKIGHFLRFDKNALEYFLKCKVKNIFDTKIASRIVRTYTDAHGLKNLVQEFCNKSLDKRHGSSDWNKDINELSDKQLEYLKYPDKTEDDEINYPKGSLLWEFGEEIAFNSDMQKNHKIILKTIGTYKFYYLKNQQIMDYIRA